MRSELFQLVEDLAAPFIADGFGEYSRGRNELGSELREDLLRILAAHPEPSAPPVAPFPKRQPVAQAMPSREVVAQCIDNMLAANTIEGSAGSVAAGAVLRLFSRFTAPQEAAAPVVTVDYGINAAIVRAEAAEVRLRERDRELEDMRATRDQAMADAAADNAEAIRARAERDAWRARAEAAELGCEIAYKREPTQAEGDAYESGEPAHAKGECFVAMGGFTGRRCRVCSRWTWGGPTACEACVVKEDRDEWKAQHENALASWRSDLQAVADRAATAEHEVERLRAYEAEFENAKLNALMWREHCESARAELAELRRGGEEAMAGCPRHAVRD